MSARAAIEDRIISALRDRVLAPENVQFTIEHALKVAQEHMTRSADFEADHRRLDEVEQELENLVGMAAKLGDLDAYSRVIDRLRGEKGAIAERLHAQRIPAQISKRALRARITEWVADFRAVFDRKQEDMRAALEELLAGSRLKVLPDPDRGFRVEGTLEWRPKTRTARPHLENGRLASVVAGARFDGSEHLSRGAQFRLPVVIQGRAA